MRQDPKSIQDLPFCLLYPRKRPPRLCGQRSRAYAENMRTSARAGLTALLVTVGLISLGELAAQFLLGDPVTPQRLAALAVAVLAAVAAGCVAAAVRIDRSPAAVPVTRRVTALRDKSWRVAFLRLRDPDARGRSRPRAPAAVPAVA
jgi:Family of unknown function (DUF6412)